MTDRCVVAPEVAGIVRPEWVFADEISVVDTDPALDEPLAAAAASMGTSTARADVTAAVRSMYKAVGIDPTRTRPSSEALLRRVKRGDSLPRINRIVDLVNWTSLETQLPFGAYDDRVLTAAKQYYETNGTVESGLNFPGDDLFRLKRVPVLSTTSPAQLRALVQQAQAQRAWLILVFHDFTTGTPSASDRYRISDFSAVLDEIAASGIEVVTVSEGAARVRCTP